MKKTVRLAALAALTLAVAACGDGSNSASTPPAPTPTPAKLIYQMFGSNLETVYGGNSISGDPTDVPPADLPAVSFTTDPIDF